MGLDFSLPSVEAFLLDALSRLRWPHGDLARLLAVSVQGSPWRDAAGTGWPPVSLRDLVSDVKTVLLVIGWGLLSGTLLGLELVMEGLF